MKKILFIASLVGGALMAKAADYKHSVTAGGDHLTNITAVVKTSPTTVMISCDDDLGDGRPAKSNVEANIKELPRPFLSAWNILPMDNPPAGGVVQPAATARSAPQATAMPGRNHTVTLPNAVTLDLIWIAPATFTMGLPDSESGDNDERPAHRVTISKGFWLGKMLVTQGQYQAVMGTNPSYFANVGADAPVEMVSLDEAMEFCRKLTEQARATGHLPAGYAYTLPTEAQWEYACRAGTTKDRYGNLDDIAWYVDNSGSSTHPVGQKQPNAFGLYDMIGNVWELCSDWYGIYPDGNVTDPVGPDSGASRVLRGGCWSFDALSCCSTFRYTNSSGDRRDDIGFRLALAPTR